MITLVKRSTKSDSIVSISTDKLILKDDFGRCDYNSAALLSLADSIQRHGVINPLTVRSVKEGYEVVSGRRRLRAAQILRLSELPCIITDSKTVSDSEFALIEDIQKQSLNMFEQAKLISDFIVSHSLTQEEASKRLSCSQSAIANKLRLLKFTEKERQLIISASLSERHARALLRIADPVERLKVLERVVREDMTVALCEAIVEQTVGESANLAASLVRSRAFAVNSPLLFYNSIEKTALRMRELGMCVTTDAFEGKDYIEIRVKLSKQ